MRLFGLYLRQGLLLYGKVVYIHLEWDGEMHVVPYVLSRRKIDETYEAKIKSNKDEALMNKCIVVIG